MELTKKEAIELLKERYMTMSMCSDNDYCVKQNAAIEMAIAALSAQGFTTEGGTVMRDNEIIEALDCCEGYNGVSFCSDCPLFGKDNCTNILSHEAYNLINRQKAEIERLNFDLQLMRGAANSFKMHYNNAKAEGIKEFAERLKDELRLDDDCEYDCCRYDCDCCYACKDYVPIVDKLVKEMTEE